MILANKCVDGYQCICCEQVLTPSAGKMFDDRYGYPQFFDIYQCNNCGQYQTAPLLADDELPLLYSKYYPRKKIDIKAIKSEALLSTHPFASFKRWLNGTNNQGQYYLNPGVTVLDYGCGGGVSLLEMQLNGINAFGLEADSNVQQVKDGLGLNILIGTLDAMPFDGVKFDAVILNQVLEHIPDPIILLNKLDVRLNDGGRVFLSFPNAKSIFAKTFGRKWINWHIPYHLHHFNPKSVKLFVKKAGWKIVSLKTITPNLWTLLQLRAATQSPVFGIENSTWGGASQSDKDGNENIQRYTRSEKLHKNMADYLSSSRRWPKILLILVNRSIDFFGIGDSILLEIRK